MGLNIAGVDMLRSNHGPVVMEVNSSPGLEGIERSTQKDVAGKIVEFIEKNAAHGKTKDDDGKPSSADFQFPFILQAGN